ncbi:MAG: glycohydrolase toxin TNT-related protein [Bacteroidota bacterium]
MKNVLQKQFLLSFLTLCIVWVNAKVIAQNSTLGRAPEGPGFSQGEDITGAIQQNVNLFTGQATFPVHLVNLSSYGDLSLNVSLTYNSTGVPEQSTTWNLDAPTSSVGLGWTLNTSKIVANNKQTGTRDDDEFFLVDAGVSNPMIRVGGTSSYDDYVLQNYQFWKIRFYHATEKWEIIKEDGKKWIYGDSGSGRNTVEWIVKWGNWIGNSAVTTNQQNQGVGWNLSSVEDLWGHQVRFTYDEVKNRVSASSGSGLFHTEASYISEIEDDLGQKVDLVWGNKQSSEYAEPHTEKAEPDAYQERYEKKFLDKVVVYNEYSEKIQEVDLVSNVRTAWAYDKRIVDEIIVRNGNDEEISTISYQYHESGAYQGALRKIYNDDGSSVEYQYNTVDIPGSNRELNISAPSNYHEPKVYIGPDYVVVFWREMQANNPGGHENEDRKVIMKLYEWVGEWKEITSAQRTLHNTRQYNDWFDESYERYPWYEFYVSLERDHFSVMHKDFGRNRSVAFAYHRRPEQPGSWHFQSFFSNEPSLTNRAVLISGDDFIVVGDYSYSESFNVNKTYVWDGSRWIPEDIPSVGHRSAYTAGPNYFMEHSATGDDVIRFFFLNKKRQWVSSTVPESIEVETDHTESGERTPYSTWHSAPTFAFALPDDNPGYVYSWNENYTGWNRFGPVHDLADNAYVQISNNLVSSFNPRFEKREVEIGASYIHGRIMAFNAGTLNIRGGLPIKAHHQMDVSVGEHGIIRGYHDQLLYKYDPNNLSSPWSFHQITPQGSYNSNFHSSEMSGNYLLSYDALFYRNTNGSYDFKRALPYRASIEGEWDVKFGYKDFIVQDENSGSRILFLKNGDYLRSDHFFGIEHNPEWNSSEYNSVVNNMIGPNIVVLSQDNMENATSLKLVRISDHKAKGLHSVKVVDFVTLDDQLQALNFHLDYDLNSALVDAENMTPEFGKVSLDFCDPITGTHGDHGSTEVSFFNARTNPIDVPGLNGGNAGNHLGLVKGSSYRTVSKDSQGNILSEQKTSFRAFSSYIHNELGVQVGEWNYIRPVAQNSTQFGVEGTLEYDIDGSNGIAYRTEQSYYNSSGVKETVRSYNVFGKDKYSAWDGLNLLTPVVETYTRVNNAEISRSATKWKDWGSGKWAPWKSYEAKNSGARIGSWTSSTESSSNWLLVNTIVSRDQYGSPVETEDIEGIYSSSVRGFQGTAAMGTVSNARKSEILIETFDDGAFNDSDPYTWSSSGDWNVNASGVLTKNTTNNRYFGTTAFTRTNNYIAEFNVKFDPGQPSGYALFFQFNKSNVYGSTGSAGHYLKLKPGGTDNLQLKLGGSTSLTLNRDLAFNEGWNHVRVVREGNRIVAYINYERVFDETVSGLQTNSGIFNFYAQNIKAQIDQIRIYPSDAYANSTTLDKNYRYATEQIGESGHITRFMYNDRQEQIATINTEELVAETSAGYNSADFNGGSYNLSDPHISHQTTVRGEQGFYSDFSYDKGSWSTTNGSSASTIWTHAEGQLKMTSSGGSSSGIDTRILTLPEIIKDDRIGVELDIRADAANSGNGFGVAVGSSNWNGASASSSMAWVYWNNYKFRTCCSSVQYSTSLELGRTYRLKIIVDRANSKVAFFLNGKQFGEYVASNSTSLDIGKVALINYTKGINATWYIDNLVVYSNPIQSSTFHAAGGKTIQVQTEEPDGILVSQTLYDEMGRANIEVAPTKVTSTTAFGYRPNFSKPNPGRTSILTDSEASVINGHFYPYSRTVYDDSPLSRPIESGGPGDLRIGNGHTVTTEISANKSSGIEYNLGDNYPAGKYLIAKTTDADGHSSYEVTNQAGQSIMNYSETYARSFVTQDITSSIFGSESNTSRTISSPKTHTATYNFNVIESPGGGDEGPCLNGFREVYDPVTGETTLEPCFTENTFNAPEANIVDGEECFLCPDPIDPGDGDGGGTGGGGSGGGSTAPVPEFRIYNVTNSVAVINWTTNTGNGSFTMSAGKIYRFELRNLSDPNTTASFSGQYISSTTSIPVIGFRKATRNEYDRAGNLVKIYPPNYFEPPTGSSPNDWTVSMAYDYQGRMSSRTTNDGGTTYYYYDAIGRPIEFRDSNGSEGRYGTYTDYDELGRIEEEGYIYNNIPSSVNIPGVSSGTKSYMANDITANGTISSGVKINATGTNSIRLTSGFKAQSGTEIHGEIIEVTNGTRVWRKKYSYPQHGENTFIRGALTKVEVNNDLEGDAEVEETYNYNHFGELVSKGINVFDYENQVHSIGYDYDNIGNITKVDYGAGIEAVYYNHDLAGRLKSIGVEGNEDFFTAYDYDENGGLKHEYYDDRNIQRTYEYLNEGWLDELSDPYLTERLTYTNLGYDNYYSYSGLIASSTFSFNWGGAPGAYNYRYKYDRYGQLLVADHSTDNSQDVGMGNQISYDANGNILDKRIGSSTKNYNYYSGTNKVRNINGSGDDYQYDAAGNVIVSLPKGIGEIVYDEYFNLTKEMRINGSNTLKFQYGSDDQRVLKAYDINGTLDNCVMYVRGTSDYPLIEKHRYEDGSEDLRYYVYGPGGIIATRESNIEPSTVTETATLESAFETAERAAFGDSYDQGEKTYGALYDHTNDGANGYAQLLRGTAGSIAGLGKVISVSPNDLIEVEVFAKYVDIPISAANSDVGTQLGANVAQALGIPATGEGSEIYSDLVDLVNAGALVGGNNDDSKPEGYLNYLLFDENYTFVQAGFAGVTENAREDGSCPGMDGCDHERLSLNIDIEQAGYLYIYVSNESSKVSEVYFDDLSITRTTFTGWRFPLKDHLGSTRVIVNGYDANNPTARGTVTKHYDFRPFGERFRETGTGDGLAYQYTGQEYDEEAGLHNYRARFYDSDLGRFLSMDPAHQFYSPYLYGFNNPVSAVDPDGELAFLAVVAIAAVVSGGVNVALNWNSIGSFSEGLGFFGVGAVAGAAGAVTGGAAAVGWTAVGTALSSGGALAAGAGFGAAVAAGAAGGATSGAILGIGNTALGGGTVGDALKNGAIGAASGAVLGAATGAAAYGLGKAWVAVKDYFRNSKLDNLAKNTPKVDIPKIDGKAGAPSAQLNASKSTLNTVDDVFDDVLDDLNASASRQNLNIVEGNSKLAPAPFYPENNGFLGTSQRTFLMPGDEISRFGSSYGRYFSPSGTPLPLRALPPGSNTNIFNNFKVLKPFSVESGVISPAFGQPGGGIQYLSPLPARTLIKHGIIAPF